MPRMTLRKYLTIANPDLLFSSTPLLNTDQKIPMGGRYALRVPLIKDQTLWEEFNLSTIESLFGRFLDESYEFPDLPDLHPNICHIRDNKGLECIFHQWNNVIVNLGLKAVQETFGIQMVTWGPGSMALGGHEDRETATKSYLTPDWAGITGRYYPDAVNFLPGDSKFVSEGVVENNKSNKSKSKPPSSTSAPTNSSHQDFWTKGTKASLEQINFYAQRCGARYCYLLTNQELVIIRRLRDTLRHNSKQVDHLPFKKRALDSPQSPLDSPVHESSPTQVRFSSNQKVLFSQANVKADKDPQESKASNKKSTAAIPSVGQRLRSAMRENASEKAGPCLSKNKSTKAKPSPKSSVSKTRGKNPSTASKVLPPCPAPKLPKNITEDGPGLNMIEPKSQQIEYQVIRWDEDINPSGHGLTVNLALWALHLLGAAAGNVRDYYHPLEKDEDLLVFPKNRKRAMSEDSS